MIGNQQNITSAVIIPLLQSGITGGLIGITAGAGAALLNIDKPGAIGLAAGGFTGLSAWLAYRSGWERRLENILGIEAQPAPSTDFASTVRVEYISDNARAGDFLHLPGGFDNLILLARGITNGKPFTTRDWVGYRKPYTGPVFADLRTELIGRGFARWKNEHDTKQGVEITAKGKALFRGIASLPTPPEDTVLSKFLIQPREQTRTHSHTVGGEL